MTTGGNSFLPNRPLTTDSPVKTRPSISDGWSKRASVKDIASKRPNDKPLIQVETFLSRPAYHLGSSLVGTVLIRHPQNAENKEQLQPLRETLKSVVVYAAGFCRIDSRWHNVAEYSRIYGRIHPFIELLEFEPKLLSHGGTGKDTVCFWATNGLDLMTLPERTNGEFTSENTNTDERLAFTFRVDLPMDLPHSMNASTCKYYYLMNILIKTQTKQKVIHTPFVVLTNPSKPLGSQKAIAEKGRVISAGRVKFGSCVGMAHSIGLPCHLSSTEIHRPKGQMTVAFARRRTDIQTLQVSNAAGKPVCLMTFVNATKLKPGSRIHLQWDFPENPSDQDWVPCYQVSACLMGEEMAVYEDGKTNRTQQHVFDTCHEYVDAGIAQRVSKSLLLSIEAPCNLYTDVMELSLKCQVDVTVKENGKYNNLTIEFPVHVVHDLEKEENFESDERHVMPLSEMMGPASQNQNPHLLPPDNADPKAKKEAEFPTSDIVSDLKNLSLQMEQRLRKSKEGLS